MNHFVKKNRSKRRNAGMIALLLCMAFLLSGCSIGNTQIFFASGSGFHQVFKIGKLSCNQKEAKMYLCNYKNLYGVIGDTNLWSGDFNTDKMETSLKDAAIEHLTKVYTLDLYANEHEITLSDEEEKNVKAAAEEYYQSLTRRERSFTGASRKDVEKMYTNYALAEKVYSKLMGDVDEEVSEDEARVIDAYVLLVTDEDLANQIATKLQNSSTFERLASTYNEAPSIKTSFGRNTYPKEVDDVVFQLDDGDNSPKITTKDGYYFFQCINKYNEALSEQNKATIIQQRKEQVITDITTNLEEKYYSDFNTKLWDKINIDTDDEIQTDSFFQVLDRYVSF